MLLLLHETSQGTFSHVFDLDSTELDEKDKDIPVNSSGKNINILGLITTCLIENILIVIFLNRSNRYRFRSNKGLV